MSMIVKGRSLFGLHIIHIPLQKHLLSESNGKDFSTSIIHTWVTVKKIRIINEVLRLFAQSDFKGTK